LLDKHKIKDYYKKENSLGLA